MAFGRNGPVSVLVEPFTSFTVRLTSARLSEYYLGTSDFTQWSLLLQKVKAIMEAVTIPVMAKCRIGHFAEAQILQSLGVDFIDESEG